MAQDIILYQQLPATHQFLEKLGKLAMLEIDVFEVYLLLHLESIEVNSRFGNFSDATIEKDQDETDVDVLCDCGYCRCKARHGMQSTM